MKLSRPIKGEATAAKPVPDEKKIEAMIEKGGSSVTTEPETDDDPRQAVRLVAYASQLREIEEALKQIPKRARPSRHAWILQAIDEKLARSRKKAKR